MKFQISNSPSSPLLRAIAAPLGAGVLAALLFLSLLLKDPKMCWRDDYALSIMPVLADIARAWNEGAWPLLSPYSWNCANLAGEYQYGTFSVFVNALIVAVFKLHLSYPATAALLSAAHIFALAAGAYLLGKKRGLSAPLATLVAIIGALNGWNVCWGATDWFGAIAALAWLPWSWWALEVALDAPRPDWRWLLPAPFIYLLLAGGFPYTVVMLIVVTAWLALRGWVGERRFGVVWPLATGWILGLGLSAPAWLSLVQYMHGSGRSQGEDIYHFAWVVPWRALPGLVLPSWRVDWPNFLADPKPHAAMEFTGALVPLAALLALAFARPRTFLAQHTLRWDTIFALAIFALCLAPSAGVFRWSFRWLPLFHLAFALAGAQALDFLGKAAETEADPAAQKKLRQTASRWAFWLAAAVILAQEWLLRGTSEPQDMRVRLYGVFFLSWWMSVASGPRSHLAWTRWMPVAASTAVMMAMYLIMPLNLDVPGYTITDNLASPAPLSRERLYLSFYRAPYLHYLIRTNTPWGFGTVLRPGSTGLFAGIHTINGYSPIHPAGIGRHFAFETHGQPDEERAIQALREEAGADGLLARLGVDGLLIARDFPLPAGLTPPADAWEQAFASDEGTVYHRKGLPSANVSAWTSREPGAPPEFAPAEVMIRRDARQQVVADVAVKAPSSLPVLVAFRRPYFPGYRAAFNGHAVPVSSYQGFLPTVQLPPNAKGELTLSYRPTPVLVGAVISLASLLIYGAAAARLWPRRPDPR